MPKGIGYKDTQEEKRKKAHTALLAMQKSMGKKTGLSLAARNARAAHSSAGPKKVKTKAKKEIKAKKLTWWEKLLSKGRTKVIEESQGPGGVKSDAVKRAERAARKAK